MSEAGRTPQPQGQRGSLKWIQRAVAEKWPEIETPLLKRLGCSQIDWLSPLENDDFAEYRDEAFLRRLGIAESAQALAAWWPRLGPQWDALARTDTGALIVVEAKAHLAEMCSPGTAAGTTSRARIGTALDAVADQLGAREHRAPWADCFYQLANRLAHLAFLRDLGHPVTLAFVNFVGDFEMRGPTAVETWEAAYDVAQYALGLPRRHPLTPHIIHLYPDVRR